MHTAARHLAARPQSRKGGGAVEVGHDAAAEVVGGRRDREEIARRVEADGPHRGGDRGEPLVEALETGGVQPQVIDALGQHALGHGAGHDVAPRQLVDEALVTSVAQQRAVAPERFRQQRPRHLRMVQGRGVELHELDVGHRQSRPQRHGHTVAGGLRRVRGHREELTGAAAGQHRVGSHHLLDGATGIDGDDAAATSAVHQQIDREPSLHYRCRRVRHRVDQCPLDLGAGCSAAGVDDTRPRVPALARQRQRATGIAVEHRTQSDELVHACRTLVDEHAHDIGVAQPGAGGEGVGQVEVGGVGVAAEHGGHAALGPASRGLGQVGLGEHAHAHAGPGCSPNRRRQPRHPAPEHEQVERDGLAHVRYSSVSVCSSAWRAIIDASTARLRESTWTIRGSKSSRSASS